MSVVPDASAQADAHNLIEAVGMQAKCTKCGRPFVRTRPDKQFCSVSCRNAAQQANRRKARRQAKAVATKSVEVPAVQTAKKDWLTPARIEPRRRLSETDTAVRKRNRRRAEALADSQRADVVRELRESDLNADQIEAVIAKRQGQDAGAMKAEGEINARLKEPRKTLAAALAVLEKIDRGEAGFLSFGVTPARRAMGEVIERTDTYIKRRGAKVAAARGVQRRRIHLATMG